MYKKWEECFQKTPIVNYKWTLVEDEEVEELPGEAEIRGFRISVYEIHVDLLGREHTECVYVSLKNRVRPYLDFD